MDDDDLGALEDEILADTEAEAALLTAESVILTALLPSRCDRSAPKRRWSAVDESHRRASTTSRARRGRGAPTRQPAFVTPGRACRGLASKGLAWLGRSLVCANHRTRARSHRMGKRDTTHAWRPCSAHAPRRRRLRWRARRTRTRASPPARPPGACRRPSSTRLHIRLHYRDSFSLT